MISICIPIYNCDVNDLVENLSKQAKLLNILYEIILIDDASEKRYKEINNTICSNEKYIELKKNIGRAAIRNLFPQYAQYDYLIFLDCDATIFTNDFLLKYINVIKQSSKQLVVCGGREYSKLRPNKKELLRWKYGIEKESVSFEERKRNPNQSFMTNNFLIKKEIFKTVRFNETINKYGHEDTLFGYELKKKGINIIHIDNPILNGKLESNSKYLRNTEEAISNLINILEIVNYDKELIKDITLLHVYFKIFKFRNIIKILFILSAPIIKYFLILGYVNLYLFDFYKLGILILKANPIQQKLAKVNQ